MIYWLQASDIPRCKQFFSRDMIQALTSTVDAKATDNHKDDRS